MAIVDLYGHENMRRRLRRLVEKGELPGSLLFEGGRGIGKQRLALWLAQLLLCERDERPCGSCSACRMILELRHPDVAWFYPRPSLKDSTAGDDEVNEDYADASAERAAAHGLYARPSGTEALYLVAIRTLVRKAGMAPAVGPKKVLIVGDAERMVAQEGADQAANAFLKLLEEPPADTTIILTSSEPGALLPTIRSRVVAMRLAPLNDDDVLAFVRNAHAKTALDALELPRTDAERVTLARGAPGDLLSVAARREARSRAARLLDGARSQGADRYAIALGVGAANARGAFSDALEELNEMLRERAGAALERGHSEPAAAAARGAAAICEAQTRADGNVNPQLVAAALMRSLSGIE